MCPERIKGLVVGKAVFIGRSVHSAVQLISGEITILLAILAVSGSPTRNVREGPTTPTELGWSSSQVIYRYPNCIAF